MRRRRDIVFLLNLMQDVNIIRPLAYLAARDLDVSIIFLVTSKFLERDILRMWQKEVSEIAADIGASIHIYETALDAVAILQGRHGIIIAASESNLSAHTETHDVLRVAPQSFLKVTLQHGYECVGFLQNREHIIAHGRNITFAADVICGWCDAASLTSLAASERPKLYVSGPTLVLNAVDPRSNPPVSGGLICENLHSVRMRATGDFGKSFMDNFSRFCAQSAEFGQTVNLRPHPGGMYVVKNNIALARNVVLSTRPMYKVDLSAYTFGVSAPSTVVLDMVFAGIPVAVWRDSAGIMDASNYDGLTAISTLEDWFAFARDAVMRRDHILEQQQRFVSRLSMPVDSKDVYRRFATLLANGTTSLGQVNTAADEQDETPRRVLFLANGPTKAMQRSFLDPLSSLFEQGSLTHDILTEADVYAELQSQPAAVRDSRSKRASFVEGRFLARIAEFAPDVIVCCRYSGPAANAIANWAEANGVALVYHTDDDLLNIPESIGRAAGIAFNQPNRLKSIDTLLKRASMIYCATPRLGSRLRHLGYAAPMIASAALGAGVIAGRAGLRAVRRIGFLDHVHAGDLGAVIDDLARLLLRNPDLSLDLLLPAGAANPLPELGSRVTLLDPGPSLSDAVAIMAGRAWDIGLCPLAATPRGALADPVKWLDYSCAGAAAVAPEGSAYEAYCRDDCGVLVGDGRWLETIEGLIDDPQRRLQVVRNAQARIEARHDAAHMQAEVLAMLTEAKVLRRDASLDVWPHVPAGQLQADARPAFEKVG